MDYYIQYHTTTYPHYPQVIPSGEVLLTVQCLLLPLLTSFHALFNEKLFFDTINTSAISRYLIGFFFTVNTNTMM